MLTSRIFSPLCERSALRASRLGFVVISSRNNSISGLINAQRPTQLIYRSVATQKVPQEKNDFLVKQRKNRPLSPHLGVYMLQQTWLGSSAWMRITGLTLSGGFYAFFLAHLLAPAFGTQFGTDELVAAYTSLSPAVQSACKFGAAFPFVFHFLNGIKQLVYDTGVGYPLKIIKYADAFQWGFSVIGTCYLAFAF